MKEEFPSFLTAFALSSSWGGLDFKQHNQANQGWYDFIRGVPGW